MKMFRKLIAAVAAIMLLTSFVGVSAMTVVNRTRYNDLFDSYGDGSSNADQITVAQGNSNSSANTTTLTSDGNASCVIQLLGTGSQVTIRQGAFSTSGTRAMSIIPSYGNSISYTSDSEAGSALVRFIFPGGAVDNEYHVSFNVITSSLTNDPGKKAYATMNWNNLGTDSPKLLYCQNNPGEGQWTVTNIGSGADNGGMGTTQTWYTYEGTLTASNAENELRFSAFGWDRFHIDDIVIKDKNGRVVFSEDFEVGSGSVSYEEGEDVLSTYKDGWEKELASNAKATFNVIEGNDGHVLKVQGNIEGDSTDKIGKYKISLPKKSSDNTYKISYDLRLKTNKTSASASIDLLGTSIYGSGKLTKSAANDEYEHIEKTFTGTGDYLYIAATSWSEAWVDNIVVKDNDDNVLFTEDFENFSEKYTYYAYETRLHGLSANGIGNRIYLSWKNPIRGDISSIEVYEDNEEVNVGGAVSLNSGEPNIVTVAVNQGAGTVHTYDVRIYTETGYVYHNYISAKERERFLDSSKTKDGIALQGWRISAGDGTNVKGLGSVYYDTDNKAVGNASLHINPNITKLSADQLDADKTSVMVVYGDGEAKAHFYLDALVDGLEGNATYRLTWKQKGHHAPGYHLYSQGFKVGDDSTSIGKVTAQSGYTNYTAWQSRELEFTVKSGSITSSLPSLRFDFDNGCDDFWLDDVKLVKVGGNGTNLIANGSFECGIQDLTRNGNNVTWDLVDSNDSVNVYRSAGDTNVKIASLAKGTTSYRIPAFEGTKQTLVFSTVKKSGDTEFISNPYTIDLTQDSYIYDAKFEIVDENYEAIGIPENLTGNVYLKTSIKVENATDSLKGADLYTLIYKGGALLNIDKQTVSTGAGEINCSTVMSVPDVSDGDYLAKVFVWNMGEFSPLKDAKTLDE